MQCFRRACTLGLLVSWLPWTSCERLTADESERVSPDSSRVLRLTRDGRFKQRPMWSPDGESLVFARHQGATIFLYVLSREKGTERRLTEGTNPELDAAFSPDGKRLLLSYDKASPNQGDIEVYGLEWGGKDLVPVATTQQQLSHEEWPSWSADGEWFAFTSTRYGNQEVCIARSNGKDETRLTNDPALDVHPAWSPDGSRIAFATDRWGDLEIAVMDRDGKNLRRLTTSEGMDEYPAWSLDSQRLAFVSNRTGNFDIFVMNDDGGSVQRRTENSGIDSFPTFSPRGELTWVAQSPHGFDIYCERLGQGSQPVSEP